MPARAPAMRGFTLIELMIGLALLAFLLLLGVPAFSEFLQNQKIRDQATLTLSALQLARAEAIRLNRPVEFAMLADGSSLADPYSVQDSTSPTGAYFAVIGEVYNATAGTTVKQVLSKKVPEEGSNQASGAGVQVEATQNDEPKGKGLVVFNSLGARGLTNAAPPPTLVPATTDVVIRFENPAGGTCKDEDNSDGKMRCLQIVVRPGGDIRLCDPYVTTAGDTRACN